MKMSTDFVGANRFRPARFQMMSTTKTFNFIDNRILLC